MHRRPQLGVEVLYLRYRSIDRDFRAQATFVFQSKFQMVDALFDTLEPRHAFRGLVTGTSSSQRGSGISRLQRPDAAVLIG